MTDSLAARLDMPGIRPGWSGILEAFFASDDGRRLVQAIDARLAAGAEVYPPDPFRVLRLIGPADVRAVILGQDPYHGPGQAVGMAFSVPPGLAKLPASLRNIFKELGREYGRTPPACGDLTGWVEQGVLLLNAVLTVEKGQAASHGRLGWQTLTDRLILEVLRQAGPCVFMLWGGWAQKKAGLITGGRTRDLLVLTANHPSPLSALRPPVPFIGCGHFRTAAEWLAGRGCGGLDWFAAARSGL